MIGWNGTSSFGYFKLGVLMSTSILIHSCLSLVNFSLLLNGSISKSFKPRRGLRQGDPLSSLLFILGSEMLTRLLGLEGLKGDLNVIKVDKNAPAITHLMHPDDLLIMCRAKEKEAASFKKYFERYCKWFGQEVNLDKSNIYFSRSTPRADKRKIIEILDFKELDCASIYLGNSLIMGRNKTKEFGLIKERLKSRLEGWRRKTLSRAGKIVPIKSVLQAIPTYSMATFKLPSGLCNSLDRITKKFGWSNKLEKEGFYALKAWEDICKPKEKGGLGFRYFEDINLAFLSKLAWKLAREDNTLWIRMLRAKYLKGHSFFQHKLKPNASFVWRSIIQAR